MKILEVLISVIYIFLLIFLSKSVKFKKTDYIKNIIITSVIGIIAYKISHVACNIFILLTSIYLVEKKIRNYKKSIFVCFMATIIQISCSYFIGKLLQHISLDEVLFGNVLGTILAYLLLGIFIVVLGKVIFKIINIRDVDFNENSVYINSVLAIFVIFCGSIYYNMYGNQQDVEINKNMIIILMSLIVILSLIVGIKAFYSDIELKTKNNELKALQNYINETEDAYLEMRKFKHDYINIISSIAGYIYDSDLNGLESYFDEKIAPLNKGLENESLKLTALKNIKIKELKGLLTIKAIQAQNKGINIDIEVVDEIDYLNWDIIPACRALGILMDNAIEAAMECETKKINLAIVKKEKSKIIIIQNTYNGKKISLKKIYEGNYSTKGENRGLGLKTLKDIISNANNIVLDTKLDEKNFGQIISIDN